MLINYIKIALRKIGKQKIYALINILGLAIGMAGTMLILLWIRDERSYDRFHVVADRIYRTAQAFHYGDWQLEQAQTPAILAPTILNECPEVEMATRVRGYRDEYIVRVGELKFSQEGLGIADKSFFQLFTFPLISGDPLTVLSEPNTVAISEQTANKYFQTTDVVGRVLNIFDVDYQISGVFRDMPDNSHFHLHVLCSFASFERYQNENWGLNVFKTYVLLRETAKTETLQVKLDAIVKNHMFKTPEEYENVITEGNYTKFPLQSITDIHLNSNLLWEFESNGNAMYVQFFTIIALFTLLIAAINYMNLATARSAGRAGKWASEKPLVPTDGHSSGSF